MSAEEKKDYHLQDIYALPEGKRAELLDGKIYAMAPPTATHQRILNFLCTEINLYFRKKQGKCEVFPAPFAVFLDEKGEKYVEPDISVICSPEKVDDSGCHGAPDWIIEIVSPSSRSMDYYLKLAEYKKAGVKEYWIVDPAKETILIYSMESSDAPVICGLNHVVSPKLYRDLEIDCSKLKTRLGQN